MLAYLGFYYPIRMSVTILPGPDAWVAKAQILRLFTASQTERRVVLFDVVGERIALA